MDHLHNCTNGHDSGHGDDRLGDTENVTELAKAMVEITRINAERDLERERSRFRLGVLGDLLEALRIFLGM